MSTDDTWIRVLNYLSRSIIPVTLITVCLGVIYSYASIQKNDLNIDHLQTDLSRVSREHNGRIQSNRIASRDNSSEISSLRAMLPQILECVKDLKNANRDERKYQKEIVKGLSELGKTVAVLIDRDKRND